MWVNRIEYELLQHELENVKKEKWEYLDKNCAIQYENLNLKNEIKNLTYEIKALKSENSALIELLGKKKRKTKKKKEGEKDDRDT